MGLPALRIEHEPRRTRPHLRVVRSAARSSSARRSAAHAAAYEAFVTFCILAAVLALAALGRVWLSAEAAQATLRSSELREEIKAARFTGDTLEMQESRLGSPGRIGVVASRTLGMAPAENTRYIDLRRARTAAPRPAGVSAERAEPRLTALVDSVVGVAAGEARVLLVGDVGLASAR